MIPCTNILKGVRTVHNQAKNGPLFIWNLTSSCNLECSHCYRDSDSRIQETQLSDEKCIALVSEIKALNPPIVLLSGGEPLLRKNLFDIVHACKINGLRVGLSTNGTLIGPDMAIKIKKSGIDYVGISIDGKSQAHDLFRGKIGAFDASWRALKFLNEIGVKTGVRFTLTAENSQDLSEILQKTIQSGTKRFCLYHLVYAGRGAACLDLTIADKRACMDNFFKLVKDLTLSDSDFEVLTTDNPADALFLAKCFTNEESALSCINSQQGCSAGEHVVYLDSTGNVYPCQFLREFSLGNIHEESLSQIWNNPENIFLEQLRNKTGFLTGKCAQCSHKTICAGCRARALALHGSLWAEDPACYLTESETKDAPEFVHP